MTIVDLNRQSGLAIESSIWIGDWIVDWIAPQSAIGNRQSAIGNHNQNRESQSSIVDFNRRSPINQIRNPQSPIRNELICHS